MLISYSICELLNSCDALIAPVRLGMVKPSFIAANFLSANDDVLELIERYLNSELDLTTLLQSNCQIQPVKTAPKKFNVCSNLNSKC